MIKKYENKYFFIKLGTSNNDQFLNNKSLKNFYDLSESDLWSQKFETLITYKSFVCLHPESGSSMLPRLLGKPLICINLSHPILNSPIHRNELSYMKKVYYKINCGRLMIF